MNQRKDIDFDECYKRHFSKYINNENSSSEGDSELEEEDILNRPTCPLSHYNDTIEYCASEPPGVPIVAKKKKKKKATPEKPPEPTLFNGNRFSCLDTELEANNEPKTNGIGNCWSLDNHSSVLKLFPKFAKKETVESKESGIHNEKLIGLGKAAVKKNDKTNLFYKNVPSTNNGSKLVQNNAVVSKKSKKNKKKVEVQTWATLTNNKSGKDSKKQNLSAQKTPVQTGAIKKKAAKVQTPQTNVGKKALDITKTKKATKKEPQIPTVWNPYTTSVQTFFDSIMFTNMIPALNPNTHQLPPLPPSHWYSDDINFPILEPGKNNIGFEHFPQFNPPPDLVLNKTNFPSIPESYFKMPQVATEDKKIAEIPCIIKPRSRKKKNKQVVEVPQNIGNNIVNDKIQSDVLKLPNLTSKSNISEETVENTVVYECVIPENIEELQNISVTSTESTFEGLKNMDVSLTESEQSKTVSSKLNESAESSELNQSFDSEQSKSVENCDNIEDSSKFPLDENHVEFMARQFLSGVLSMEQIWYCELGPTMNCLHVLDKPKKKRSKKSKKLAEAITESPENGLKLTAATSISLDRSPSGDVDVESCTGYGPVPIEEFDNMKIDYFTVQRSPEELSVSYIYSSANQSLISFCDDTISKIHVKPVLDSNTGIVTLKSPLRYSDYFFRGK